MTITLREHQAEAVRIAKTRKRFAFFWKPGTGKTIACLAIQKIRPMRTLVLCQKSIFETAWAKDARAMGVHCVIAWDKSKPKRLRKIATPGEIVLVTNYEQFRNHRDLFLDSGVRRLVIDESSKVKNRKSKIAEAVIEFSDQVEEVYILSGTPSPNCPTELWSQLRAVSAKSVGRNFFRWAYHWFTPIKKNTPNGTVIDSWVHKDEKRFVDSISGWAWYLSKEECVDLPAQSDIVLDVVLSKEEQETYLALGNAMSLALGETNPALPFEEQVRTVSVEASSSMMKRRQCVGGFVIDDAKRPNSLGTSKLDVLNDLLDELGPREPVLIWAQFTHEIDAISELLRKRGERSDTIDGRTREPIHEIVNRFVAGETTRIVAHPQAAGHGTDGLQKVCAYAIYYSISFSQEQEEQSRDRLHRVGQTKPVTYYYLAATVRGEESIDHEMYKVVKGKTTKQEALLRELQRDLSRSKG